MKRFSLKVTSLLMAVLLLLTFIPSVAQSDLPTEEQITSDFTEIDSKGIFNKAAVTLYSNPLDLSDTLVLPKSNMPSVFTVQYKFVDSDNGSEWYMLDTENWEHDGWNTDNSKYGYAEAADVTLVASKTDTCGVYKVGDKLIFADDTESAVFYNDSFFTSSADTDSTQLTVDKFENTGKVFEIKEVKSVLDGDCKTVYYYKINNLPSDYESYYWITAEGFKLSTAEGDNAFTAYTQTTSDSDISVYIRVPDGAFDTDVLPAVSPVANDGVYRSAVESAIKESDPKYSLYDTFSYNISFINPESGDTVEPSKEIGITAFFKNGVLLLNGMTEKLRFYHMNENNGTVTAEFVGETDRYSTEASFSSKNFSVYTLAAVGTPAVNNTNVADVGAGTESGLEVKKSLSSSEADGYKITLEAYATGSKITSAVTHDQPTDIVLVLDQSGSMKNNNITTYKHSETYSVKNNKTYYVKNGSYYQQLYYCSTCGCWRDATCTNGIISGHNAKGTAYTPKTAANDTDSTHTQFYTRTQSTTTRLTALKECVNDFIDSVEESAKGTDGVLGTDDDINHRMAIVGFASAKSGSSYENTELLSTQNVVNYGSANANNYKDALISVISNGEVNSRLTTAISRLDGEGDTYSEYGIDMANKIFAQYNTEADKNRNRIVVMVTDGYTAPSGTNDFKYSMANKAIEYAEISKQTYNATVYSIGIFNGADSSADITQNFKTSDGWSDFGNANSLTDTQEKTAANRYMHYVSSNYPNAKSLTNGGTMNNKVDPFNKGNSFYLSVNDDFVLDDIFSQIAGNITTGGSQSSLTAEAVLKDVISLYFELEYPSDPSEITVSTAQYKGTDPTSADSWETPEKLTDAKVEIDGNEGERKVSVTGFDYSENWVGEETASDGKKTYRGKKLIVEIPIKVRDGFLGGNNVPTNDTKDGDTVSGIYENADSEEAIEYFTPPTTDVTIKEVKVTANDKNVYLLGTVTADQLKDGVKVECGTVDITDPSKLEDWQKDYVNINITNPTEGKDGLKDDTTYKVSATVSPKTEGNAKEQSGEKTAKIYVFKPTLTFKDSTVYYGDNAPDSYDENKVGVVEWTHGEMASDSVTMIGSAPTLNLTYPPESGKIADGKINTKNDISVGVTVKIGDTDIETYTTFKHTDCSGESFKSEKGKRFLLHVKTCSLDITKNLHDATADENELFIFNIKKDDKYYTSVTVKAGATATIKELPVGKYTVEEDKGWSWRYTTTSFNRNYVELSSTNTNGSFVCTNQSKIEQWLSGFAEAVANIFGVAKNGTSNTATANS